MHEWKQTSKDGEQPDLEEHLAAYYGPRLQEQPLSSASWQRLRSRLGPQHPTRSWRMPRLRRFWRKNYQSDPAYIRETFYHIMQEARVFYPPSLLQCSFKTRIHGPSLRVSAYGRHKIKLILPLVGERIVSQLELDILVATGLARYLCMRNARQRLLHLLMIMALLLAFLAAIFFGLRGNLIAIIPIAIMLCTFGHLHVQGRLLAFRADTLVVQWLGRETVCRGLHALADHSRSPRRSRWSEPSLAERIHRVCGTEVTIEEDRLMLVR